MAVILEKVESRATTVDVQGNTVTLNYICFGTEDDAVVLATCTGGLPATYAGLFLQSFSYEHQGGGNWAVEAEYGNVEPKDVGQSTYSFDTGGGTTHITQSINTTQGYAAPPANPADFKGAIGVNGDSVEGADIVIPQFNFTETHYLPDSLVTGAYKLILFDLTGRTNVSPFKGFAAGEVLFLGASGTKRGQDAWEITFRFAASANQTGLTIGDITGIDKNGHEYLWVRFKDDESEETLVKVPSSVYVEQVYYPGNMSLLGIGA